MTTVLETPSGTFSVWLSREDEAASVDGVEHEPDAAQRAAEAALKDKTGHTACSDRCSAWRLHTHEFGSDHTQTADPGDAS